MATLTFFGKLSDLTGQMMETVSLPSDVTSTDTLCAWLEETRGLKGVLTDPSIRIALNDEILHAPAPLTDADDVAFLPPVGGG